MIKGMRLNTRLATILKAITLFSILGSLFLLHRSQISLPSATRLEFQDDLLEKRKTTLG